MSKRARCVFTNIDGLYHSARSKAVAFWPALVALIALVAIGPVTAATINPGDILVADSGSGTIRQFSAAGTDLGVFVSGLSLPSWITADSSGNIYVSEFSGGRVDKLSPSGVILLTISTPYSPGGVVVSHDGTIYLGDYFGANVYHFSASGASLGLFVATGLTRADFLALDRSGNLYVTDFNSGVVRQISPAGVIGGDFVSGFVGAEGIEFDASGNLYVSSYNTNIIEKYSPSGVNLGTFASIASGSAYGIAFDSDGNLYVANYAEGAIRKFSPSGTDLGIFASGLVLPRDLVVVPTGGPKTKDECKDGGWRTFAFPRAFKNQGDCIQFVNTRK